MITLLAVNVASDSPKSANRFIVNESRSAMTDHCCCSIAILAWLKLRTLKAKSREPINSRPALSTVSFGMRKPSPVAFIVSTRS